MPNPIKGHKVTFIAPGTELAIRFMENDSSTICRAAKDLKATHFIASEGWDDAGNHAIWGVFEMRTAQENTPIPGRWSINDPIKTFPNVNAAVMFALAQRR